MSNVRVNNCGGTIKAAANVKKIGANVKAIRIARYSVSAVRW
jgi:hypothetical protein